MNAWIIALAPVIGLAINTLSQMIAIRLTKRLGISLLAGIVCGALFDISLLVQITTPGTHSSLDIFASLLTYLALSFCFWAFINLNVSSLRIRMMKELLSAGENGLSTDHMLQQYSPEEMLQLRIQRLANTRHIELKNGHWILLSRKLLRIAQINILLRKVVMPATAEVHRH